MKLFLVILFFLLTSSVIKRGDDLIIDTSIDSCDRYRNIKITFINCGVVGSSSYITNCKIDSNQIIVPNIMKFPNFRQSYESSTHIKIKILKGVSCEEQIIKI